MFIRICLGLCLLLVIVAVGCDDSDFGVSILGKVIDNQTLLPVLIPAEEDTANEPAQEDITGGIAHIIALNISTPINEKLTIQKRIDQVSVQGGLAIIAHPEFGYRDLRPKQEEKGWGISLEKLKELRGYTGIEIYNSGREMDEIGWRGWHELILDRIRKGQAPVWGFAVDDAHRIEDIGKGFIVIRSKNTLARDIVLETIKKGSFYASNGAYIDDIYGIQGSGKARGAIGLTFSQEMNVTFIFGRDCSRSTPITGKQASCSVNGDEIFIRAEVQSPDGKKAWTQLFLVKADGTIINPYSEEGKWYKGNVHCHTTNSTTYEEPKIAQLLITPSDLVKKYRERGYSFLAISDHNYITSLENRTAAPIEIKTTGKLINPHVSVSPTCGEQGTTFNEPGWGFSPNSTATLYFKDPHGKKLTATEHIDSEGRYSHSWTSSSTSPPGTYSYWAVDDSTSKMSNIVSFSVTYKLTQTNILDPQISVAPAVGPPGSNFEVRVIGCTPNNKVKIEYQSGTYDFARVTKTETRNTDGHGNVIISLTMKSYEYKGEHAIWAVDLKTGKESRRITFTIGYPQVYPKIVLSATSIAKGQTLDIKVTGCTPNNKVKINNKPISPYGFGIVSWLKTCNTDSLGSAITSLSCPDSIYSGEYTVWAVDVLTGAKSDIVRVTVK